MTNKSPIIPERFLSNTGTYISVTTTTRWVSYACLDIDTADFPINWHMSVDDKGEAL